MKKRMYSSRIIAATAAKAPSMEGVRGRVINNGPGPMKKALTQMRSAFFVGPVGLEPTTP